MTNNHAFRLSRQIRLDILRMGYLAQSAHSGGAYSVVEILIALYWNVMKVFPRDPYHESRDRLIFSKAHDAKALFSALARKGFFDPTILDGYEQDRGKLHGHSTRHTVPGIEVSAGSLGHGLPMATGIAFGLKRKKSKARVFVVLSDGECNEGTTWESALYGAHHQLDNLTCIIDRNMWQGFGKTEDVLSLEPLADKWKAFGWTVIKVKNGHDVSLLTKAINRPHIRSAPTVIIARTIKGLGGVAKHVDRVTAQYKPPTTQEYNETSRFLLGLSSMSELIGPYKRQLD